MHGNDLYVLGNGINIALLSIGTNSQNSSRYSIPDWMQISIRSDKLKSFKGFKYTAASVCI